MGDRNALTRMVRFHTTAKRLYNKAQGRFSAPWENGRFLPTKTLKGFYNVAHL